VNHITSTYANNFSGFTKISDKETLWDTSPNREFFYRHCGTSESDIRIILKELNCNSILDFINKVVPATVINSSPVNLSSFPHPLSEHDALLKLYNIVDENKNYRNFIGCGYYPTVTPQVILRNILLNPGWYTQYTPYQPEISQGRLEALLNFQTMICELTGLPVANASLLDEGTAAAESLALALATKAGDTVAVSKWCHPQTIDVVKTRMEPLGIKVYICSDAELLSPINAVAVLLQYPDTRGALINVAEVVNKWKANNSLVVLATDLLALTQLTSPGELGADIAIGSSQRFGVPIGFGGPHAAFFATTDELKRKIPGRIVGVSRDAKGNSALRLALQTREQHIRREKATSNICTSQVLLAVIAGMYGVYHGPEGLKRIATTINQHAKEFAELLHKSGYKIAQHHFFDTIKIECTPEVANAILNKAYSLEINLRSFSDGTIGISFDECYTKDDYLKLIDIFSLNSTPLSSITGKKQSEFDYPSSLKRKTPFMQQKVFQQYRTETEFQRYVRSLEAKDLSLCHSMIPLGSCTMKLNSAAEMAPITWSKISELHPHAPVIQTKGYIKLIKDICNALCEMTGFTKVSLQPNAGSQGEYAGLLAIRAYHKSRGDNQRNVCVIPSSAHGTNPASAVMAGMNVVVVKCDNNGNIDINDLKQKVTDNDHKLAALMITYPSTHGVFESHIRDCINVVHASGGLVYMDGANLNALLGVVNPAQLGMDVCHMNLHKTFCIPHGGGGPGVGPIAVNSKLAPFLPAETGSPVGLVSSAYYGSASILPITWMYLAMMGGVGVVEATHRAILHANYIANRLNSYYPVLFKGENGFVAHECILDLRPLKNYGIEVDDIAKRLMDFGIHAPTVSWPVAGTMMVEPTESESLDEMNRFCEAMILIHQEACAISDSNKSDNILKNAPHTAYEVTKDTWDHSYSRHQAAYPTKWTKERKFWPAVSRIDAAFGDRNLICSCSDFIEDD
jgi:glycine dehydrogenase